ncbi:MAG: bifunctional diaminohydroxyphosphoribosylaminopyrimidine deaminase/5-amino-6-(5-phosphoribosylamino)uracil reductase RibD [Candidatus Tectomicrobia bacterium]|uniref:Riboflavin biosynthesis protein RibD n=1 Tax=Tectimicrobiota bacterium TaxID=2528274 RepID=A0A932LZM7_UNCTE|nr:bifunctional diaminohydroxyphosphoribosylaminopyrimidine deaminase/5-amino-6-(5-phosphoribosylamino)uracil reductase RibD [Candidatus Tectomicrobia bacterium]
MRQALTLARNGLGLTNPNPLVGAVIVRDGEVVGSGYHQRAGLEHAEILALRMAGEAARGATLHVNLEPCCHSGKTPPCTRALIAAGLKRVVAGMEDPNPLVAGKGIRELREAGIEVTVGILEGECRQLNEAFIKYISTGSPFVTAKVAMTLDGKIATRTGESRWITGEEARRRAHQMRSEADAVLVGSRTVQVDDPELTVRLPGRTWPRQPLRVILDSKLSIPLSYKVFCDGGGTLVVGTDQASAGRLRSLEEKGISVLILPSRGGRVDLSALVRELGRRTVSHLLIEGGGEVIGDALSMGVVDKMVFFIAPKILGGREAVPAVGGPELDRLAEARSLSDVMVERVGEDILVSGYFRPSATVGVH